jgi:hygromycin-B 7''-O-kinase
LLPALPTLPTTATEAEWDQLFADDAALLPGVLAILQPRALDGWPRERFDSGTLPVYAIGETLVLKLYPPQEAASAEVERRVLERLQGRLPLPTPEVVATGTHDGWPWLLMTRLAGQRLVDAWPTLAEAERDRLAADIGTGLAAMHALNVETLADLPPPRWREFFPAQRASAAQRQRHRGLAPALVEQIDPFLDRWVLPAREPLVLLHTEVMREHLLVGQRQGRWLLSGLFDFEPAMLGEALYEFASVGLFVSCGDSRRLRRLLQAHGGVPIDETLSMRLMAMTLLHRYSHLPWYLKRMPLPGATTLEQLAGHWFGIDGGGG